MRFRRSCANLYTSLRFSKNCAISLSLACFGNFARNNRGNAVIELALALPVMLMLGFGGFEMTRYILIQQKISKTVSSMSDLVARSPSISNTEVTQMFNAVPHLMAPYYTPADAVVIISSVANYGSGPVITWQRSGGGTKATLSAIGTQGGAATLPAGFTLNTNENTIVAEIYYDYDPVVAPNILAASTLYKARFNMPRLGRLDTIKAQ